ncbi:MAG: hypothetical protein QNK23_10165 [Crocinitomicaceae bacterium]|nr:hypothetical protein [Crocinitomicaceae bacterium]
MKRIRIITPIFLVAIIVIQILPLHTGHTWGWNDATSHSAYDDYSGWSIAIASLVASILLYVRHFVVSLIGTLLVGLIFLFSCFMVVAIYNFCYNNWAGAEMGIGAPLTFVFSLAMTTFALLNSIQLFRSKRKSGSSEIIDEF